MSSELNYTISHRRIIPEALFRGLSPGQLAYGQDEHTCSSMLLKPFISKFSSIIIMTPLFDPSGIGID